MLTNKHLTSRVFEPMLNALFKKPGSGDGGRGGLLGFASSATLRDESF